MTRPDERGEAIREWAPVADLTFEVRTCQQCGDDVVAIESATPTCHGRPTRQQGDPITDLTLDDMQQFLSDIASVPASGTAVAATLLDDGIVDTAAISEHLSCQRDRVVSALDRLVDAGCIDRTRLSRDGGGDAVVYYSQSTRKPATLAEFGHTAAVAGDTGISVSESSLTEQFRARFSKTRRSDDQDTPS